MENVTWSHLLTAVSIAGVAMMTICGWLFTRQASLDRKIDEGLRSVHARIDEQQEEKQDKGACDTTHGRLMEALRALEKGSATNGERLARIETCLEFLVQAIRDHKAEHQKMRANGI